MELRILGPIEVLEDGRTVQLPGGKPRTLLAMLALRCGEVVSTDAIVDGLWGEHPPETAGKSIQIYVSRLRKALGEQSIVTRSPGYLLAIEPDRLDLVRFQREVEDARSLSPVEASAALRDALALWRGPALADVAAEGFARAESARLEELRLGALEDRIDADIAAGADGQVVGELEALVRQHPYRERMRGQLMLALYRAGRQVEALDVYRETRSLYAVELGLEPGQELRELERRVLEQDPTLAPAPDEMTEEPRPRRRRRRIAAAVALLLVAAVGTSVGIVALASGDGTSPVVASSNSVAVIDPATNAVVDAIALGERPTRVVTHGDDVWVLHPDRGTLAHLSGSEHRLVATVGVGRTASGLAAEERGAWVSDAHAGRVTLIERERLTVAMSVKARQAAGGPYTDPGQLAMGFGSLWFASGDRVVSRIDPLTGHVTALVRPVSTGSIAVGAGSVWLAGPVQESPLTRIDPLRNRISARIAIRKFRSSGIAFGRGLIWMTDAGNNQVWRIDPSRNVTVGTTHVGVAPLGVAFAHGSIWVANAGDGTVSRIDPISGTVVATIDVGGSPTGIAATDHEIWVTVA